MGKTLQNKTIQKLLLGFSAFVFVIVPLFAFFENAQAQSPAPAPAPAAAAAPAPAAPATEAEKAAAEKSAGMKFLTSLGNTIGNIILNLASVITYTGGMILQLSIESLILGMGKMMQGGLGVTVNQAWTTIRDVANLAFIFGFIYTGLKTILDYDSAETKRVIASIIMGALLINFSLFFTKVIIDASNYLAVEINQTMLSGKGTISAQIADIMGIQTWYNPMPADTLAGLTSGGNIAFFIMGAIFLIVAGFVLAAGGVLIIVRFVVLIFIMVFSPILFAATVFPQTKHYADDLWKKLLSNAFFAPAYLFLLLVSIKLIKGAKETMDKGGDFTKAFTKSTVANGDFFDVVIVFIVCILCIACIDYLSRSLNGSKVIKSA